MEIVFFSQMLQSTLCNLNAMLLIRYVQATCFQYGYK